MTHEDYPVSEPGASLHQLTNGQQLDDFLLIEEVAHYPERRVFLAEQVSMQRQVVLEVRPHDGEALPDLIQLDHPHIVRVFDRRLSADGRFQLTHMQHVAVGSLADIAAEVAKQPDDWNGERLLHWLDCKRPQADKQSDRDSIQRQRLSVLSWPETVCTLADQIASAISYAERLGVAPQALTAADVLLTANGVPKVKPMDCQRDAQRPAGVDAFAIAAIVKQLIIGSSHQGELRVDAELISPLVPNGLAQVLRQALSSNPAERFQTTSQLASQLRICADRDSARLMLPPHELLRKTVLRFPLAISLLTLLIPNVLAGAFNYLYNEQLIVAQLDANDKFNTIMFVINSIAYPGACIIAIGLLWSVGRHIGLRRHARDTQAAPQRVRQACLDTPVRLAVLGICAWCIAGVAYPLAMAAAGTGLRGGDAVHFFASLLMCGLIGATYPFFGAAAFVVGAWYPALVRPQIPSADDLLALVRLENAARVFLGMAGLVPLLGLALLALFDQAERPILLGTLSSGGVAVLIAIFFLWNRTARDIKTLKNLAERQ